VKFKVSDDVAAPVGWTWAGFVDFAGIENEIRARGADLGRVGDWSAARQGAAWRGSVPVRGKTRPIEAVLTTFQPETCFVVESRVGGMTAHYEATFTPLSPEVTRVSVTLELKASTLSARLLLQTLKLGRRRVIQRLEGAIVRQGQAVERAWRAQAGV
jgi:hypothetical protein